MATAPPRDDTANADRVREMFQLLNERDVSTLRPFWTEETVERFPDRTCYGADEMAAYFEDLFAAMPDFQMEVVATAANGDDVLVHWRLTGTHDGPVMGIQPTGKKLAIDGMDHLVIRDDKVVSNFVVFDQMQYARQLGMLPPDGSAGDKAFKAAFNARTRVAQRLKR